MIQNTLVPNKNLNIKSVNVSCKRLFMNFLKEIKN